MRRRKLLIGMASLAAGGAATMGTGALSSVRADRSISGVVVGDERAYLEINGFNNEGLEHPWALETSGNQVEIALNQDPDYNQFDGADGDGDPGSGNAGDNVGNDEAEGLNPDAVSEFDEVFRVQNDGTEKLDVYFTNTPSNVTFYGHRGDNDIDAEPGRDSLEGASNAVTLAPFDEAADPDDDGASSDDVSEDPGVAELIVGIQVDLRNQNSFSGGEFTVVAEETNDNENGSEPEDGDDT